MPPKTKFKPILVALPSSNQQAPEAVPNKRVFASPKVYFNQVGYCSLSEAVCASLLELFVPEFRSIEGISYQIPMGNGSSVDFLIKGTLLEYHGVRFRAERGRYGDFNSRQEYVQYYQRLRQVRGNRYKRQELVNKTRSQLTQNYFYRRRRLIDQNHEHRQRELIVVTSCDELFDQVIRRFNRSFCPTRSEFRQIFYALVKVIARENSISRQRLEGFRERA